MSRNQINSKLTVLDTIEHTVAGIPCLIGVTYFHKQPANSRADNPDDFYGYTESEWILLDRRGYRATWLDAKLTDSERDSINEAIDQHFQE